MHGRSYTSTLTSRIQLLELLIASTTSYADLIAQNDIKYTLKFCHMKSFIDIMITVMCDVILLLFVETFQN